MRYQDQSLAEHGITNDMFVAALLQTVKNLRTYATDCNGNPNDLPVQGAIRNAIVTGIVNCDNDEHRVDELKRYILEHLPKATRIPVEVVKILGAENRAMAAEIANSNADMIELHLYLIDAPGYAKPAWYPLDREEARSVEPSSN